MGKIKASMMMEILGRPAENVSEALRNIVTSMNAENGVKVLEKTYHDPKPLENSDLFTAFVEVDVELDGIEYYFGMLFAYMPSNVEIIEPEKMSFTNTHLNELGNVLLQRLHNYDAVAKNLKVERDVVLQHLQKADPEAFKKLTTPPKKELEKKD